jgi:hypothetical protein
MGVPGPFYFGMDTDPKDAESRLTDIKVDELSLVDRAANQRRFIFMKRNGMKTDKQEIPADVKQAALRMLTEGLEKLTSLVAQIKEAPEGEGQEEDALLPGEFTENLEAIMEGLKAVAEQYPSKAEDEKEDEEEEEHKADDVEKNPKVVAEALERLQAVANAFASLEEGAPVSPELMREVSAIGQMLAGPGARYPSPESEAKADDEDDQEDTVDKIDLEQIPEGLRDDVAKALKKNEDADAKLVELQKQLDGERDARELKDMIEHVSKTYKNLPNAKAEDLAPILKSLKSKAPEEVEKLEEILKAADKAIGEGNLFKEHAPQDPDVDDDDSPYGQIEKLAALYIEKSGDSLTKEQAIDKVLQTPAGKKLYAEHRASSN